MTIDRITPLFRAVTRSLGSSMDVEAALTDAFSEMLDTYLDECETLEDVDTDDLAGQLARRITEGTPK
jgi:hypothetical protein